MNKLAIGMILGTVLGIAVACIAMRLQQNDRPRAVFLHLETGWTLRVIDTNDFDASYDGVYWWHLGGEGCRHGVASK